MTDRATLHSAAARVLCGAPRHQAADVDDAPDAPGVYAWWLTGPGGRRDLGLTRAGGARPLYVGVAGSLRQRLRSHLGPTDRGSYLSFRWRLQGLLAANGAVAPSVYRLLAAHVALQPGAHRRLTRWDAAEAECTAWMLANVSASVVEGTSLQVARGVEAEVITDLLPLLNQTKRCRAAAADAFTERGRRNARTFFGGGEPDLYAAAGLVQGYWPKYPHVV